jgi:calcineurin-like phosphoesterase family protein
MIFFTSDLHFFHDNIIRYCNRPFADAEQMNRDMLSRINSVVGHDDQLVIVGDVSAGLKGRKAELSEIVRSMRGQKRLVLGNHDHLDAGEYEAMGFASVQHWMELGDFFVVHYPMAVNPNDPRKLPMQERAMHHYDSVRSQFKLVIHGHIHSTGPELHGHFNVAADRHMFTPVSIEQIATRAGIYAEAQ